MRPSRTQTPRVKGVRCGVRSRMRRPVESSSSAASGGTGSTGLTASTVQGVSGAVGEGGAPAQHAGRAHLDLPAQPEAGGVVRGSRREPVADRPVGVGLPLCALDAERGGEVGARAVGNDTGGARPAGAARAAPTPPRGRRERSR
ncbi:hypothetical protein GCM10023224_40550 [Streptomonospora halophila]|uniref:Uncharacterized protein n=1 Tax=Streptomonospora halophila TaxID=427369 RepID=A0ABP9GUB8_9ACTN